MSGNASELKKWIVPMSISTIVIWLGILTFNVCEMKQESNKKHETIARELDEMKNDICATNNRVDTCCNCEEIQYNSVSSTKSPKSNKSKASPVAPTPRIIHDTVYDTIIRSAPSVPADDTMKKGCEVKVTKIGENVPFDKMCELLARYER